MAIFRSQKPVTRTVDDFVLQVGKSAKRKLNPQKLEGTIEFLKKLDLENKNFTFISPEAQIERFSFFFCRGQKTSI